MSEDLRNADLSGLAFEQMNRAQRAEMKRRYDEFIRRLPRDQPQAKPAPPAADLKRWAPAQVRSGETGRARG